MSPSIGRIVHYRDKDGSVFPAIVNTVHSEDLVNLTVFRDVFDERPQTEVITSVNKQDETDGASIENRRWLWPPRVDSGPKADPDPDPGADRDPEPEPAAA